jgi:hypothetical protein
MRALNELLKGESSWKVVEDMMSRATNKYEILPKSQQAAEIALVGLQQSIGSLMAAITYETGGILFDHGWLRLLGSGHERMTRTIANWNLGRSHETAEETPGFLMVADDVLGGIFAVNGNELGEDMGGMYYLAPDTCEWEPMEVTYHEFLEFCFVGQISDFYQNMRWHGWEAEVAALTGDQALAIIPPLWAEGDEDLGERDRIAIPMDESFDVTLEVNNMLYEDMGEDEDGEGGHSCCGGGCDCEDGDCDSNCDCEGEDGTDGSCDCGCNHK